MKKVNLIVGSVCMSTMLLSGCASIVDGTHQSVSVQTTPINGALCSLQNNKGKWFVNPTPGSVTVHKSYKALHVECNKAGYAPASVDVKSHVKAMLAGNILIGGGIGAGVDVGDGAAYQYPNLIKVPMQPQPTIKHKHHHRIHHKNHQSH